MEQIMNYVKPELLIVAVVLYFIGMGIKKSEVIPDKYIPAILGALGILICGIYVIATCAISGAQEIAMAIFTAITQGKLHMKRYVTFWMITKMNPQRKILIMDLLYLKKQVRSLKRTVFYPEW